MADTGKQSPLGQNVLGGILQNRCLQINPNAEFFMGISKSNSQYTFGSLVENTVLRMLVWSINDGYLRGVVSNSTYNNLISISGNNDECHALGNSKPPTYIAVDPSGSWAGKTEGSVDCKSVEFGVSKGVAGSLPGPANAGYSVTSDTDYGQQATWLPYDSTNANKSITQWGWIRCHALQAHNEFNFHAKEGTEGADLDSNPSPNYENFCGSFNEAYSFTQYTNKTVATAENAQTFLEGTFSNMNDLITGDVTGVSLFTEGFAYDLNNLQKVLDFKKLDRFGFPSTLLQQLHENGGMTKDLNLALGASGLSEKEIRHLSTAKTHGTAIQERKIYTAFLSITGENLRICASSLTDSRMFLEQYINANFNDSLTIRTLADLLNPWYLFREARTTLTVPVYNPVTNMVTGSKTYYPIYSTPSTGDGAPGGVNSQLNEVKEIIGTLITKGEPVPLDDPDNYSSEQELPKGFDSYLGGPNRVIPAAIGLACGALRYSLLQISNIEQITPGTLGNCLQFLQTMQDIGSGANGTEADAQAGTLQKPVNTGLVDEIQQQMGLGSNIAGQYRMDDFFGNMSGNPYNWRELYSRLAGENEIGNVTAVATTSNLAAIYQQLFLTVSWEAATGSVQTSLRAEETGVGTGEYNYFYTVTGLTITNSGGGYGRASAPTPSVTISGTSGATGSSNIGRNDQFTGSNGTGTFGRVTALTLVSPGIEIEYASAQPSSTPTDPGLTVTIETPPSGTYAWLPATGGTNGGSINFNTATQYYINAANAEITNICNNDPSGQRTLNTIWSTMGKQMKVEQRTRYNALGRVEVPSDPFVYSNQDLVSFVDSIPDYADYRTGRGARVTLELIVDRDCDVGQNIVAQLRQENNEKALSNCGIPINNNIPDTIAPSKTLILLSNGTIAGAQEGIELDPNEWVNPSWPEIAPPGGPEPSSPGGFADPAGFIPLDGSAPGNYDPLYNDVPNPQVGPIVASGPPVAIPRIPIDDTRQISIAFPVDDGGPNGPGNPGDPAGPISPTPPFIPQQTPEDAIEQVIHCNCDCWDLLS